MKLTYRQKRILVGFATPLLSLLYRGYRVVSLEAFHRSSGRTPKRILVVRLDTIGDVILSETAIRTLKNTFSKAQLDVVVAAAGRAVLLGNPNIDRFYVYDAPWHAAWRGQKINRRSEAARVWKMIRELRRNNYDLAVELRGDLRDIAFMAATKATVKVGSGWRGGSFFLDVDADVDVNAHRVEFALGIARAAGARGEPSPPKVWLGDREKQAARAYLPDDDTSYIGIHLGAGFPSKCLPVAKFAQAATAMIESSVEKKRQIVVVGGNDDRMLFEAFSERFAAEPVDLVGRLNLLETAAVLERCDLFVGNDSGPMHLAAAVGTPVVTFFGPSEPQKYRPYMVCHRLLEAPLDCRPCDHIHCSQQDYICMTRIEVADIVAAAEELLSQSRLPERQTR